MTYVIIQRPWIAESFMQSLLNSGFKTQILNIWFLSFLFEHLVDVLFKATVPPAAAAAIHISPSPNPLPRPVWHEPRHWMDPKCFLLRRCQGRSNWAEKKSTFPATARIVSTHLKCVISWRSFPKVDRHEKESYKWISPFHLLQRG